MKKNTAKKSIYTHEGGKAKVINAEQQLRRSVLACMLWEDSFYENGESIAERIKETVALTSPDVASKVAIDARTKYKLRHAPLLIVREMSRLPKHKKLAAFTLNEVIQRADELSEFLAIYWSDKREPLSAQVKKGLAMAFTKFDAHSLAKYNRDAEIKLRDVLFLCHAKPKDEEQAKVWKQLVDGKLPVPDTWEVSLSTGADKKETWERLLKENKLGSLALIRNLRNMNKVGVDKSLIFDALDKMKVERILPFRFITAARHNPQWESKIEDAMMKCLDGKEKLLGRTILLVDVSGSMDSSISAKSEMARYDAANGLAILARELCEDIGIYTFSNDVVQIPDRHGFALRDSIANSQYHRATYLKGAVERINKTEKYDRLIVLTDEQSQDGILDPTGKGYVINVASYENGVGYGSWTHIDGWSEAVFDYIVELEKEELIKD